MFTEMLQLTPAVAQQASNILSTLDLTELATKLMAMIGAGMGAWWLFKTTVFKSEKTQQKEFYATLLEEYYTLRDSTNDLHLEVSKLKNEIHDLKEQLEFYEENHLAADSREMIEHVMNFNDRPKWIHCVGTSKWYLNDKFCDEFMVDRKNFWTPVNVFARFNPEDILRYAQNDLQVIKSNATLIFDEDFCRDIMNPECPEKIKGIIKKSAFEANNNIYVVGEILEINGEKYNV